MSASADMVSLFQAELSLCGVGPGQTVALLSEGVMRADYAQAFLVAARDLGAVVFHINLPQKASSSASRTFGKTALAGNQPAIDALKSADMVVDLMGLLFSREQLEITQSGTRVLLVVETFEVLRHMFPNEDLRRRVEAAETRLAAARELRITSAFGTNIRYGLSQYPILTEYGYTDTPGRWDHWPSGFLLTQGNDEDVEGTVVLMPGDIVNAFMRYIQSPVEFTVSRGRVTAINGDGMDAALLRSYIESFDDERAYAVSHIGWGLNERANWHNIAVSRNRDHERGMHGLAFLGNVLFSLGPNTEVGGTNDTPCHLDMPMRNCSLYLDEEMIIDSGRVISKDMQVAKA